MSTISSRLGLILPTAADQANITDINTNMLKLDTIAGLITCTSTTRPSTNLYVGMQIYETDTGRYAYLSQITPATWSDVAITLTSTQLNSIVASVLSQVGSGMTVFAGQSTLATSYYGTDPAGVQATATNYASFTTTKPNQTVTLTVTATEIITAASSNILGERASVLSTTVAGSTVASSGFTLTSTINPAVGVMAVLPLISTGTFVVASAGTYNITTTVSKSNNSTGNSSALHTVGAITARAEVNG